MSATSTRSSRRSRRALATVDILTGDLSKLRARFALYVRRGPGCWLWTGTSAPNGQRERYGLFRVGPTKIGAHRVAYALAYGPPAPGLLVCHSCDTPLCVRPDHLVAGTHQDNADDMRAKGRSPVRAGEANPSARLTLAAVREIRESTVPRGELAARFGVTPDHITRIRSRRRWVVASGG